ncbi:hypothetical protein A2G24_00940 [Listeria monocytogenes]|nr:hypothetical protein [Listeria monocytogenes]
MERTVAEHENRITKLETEVTQLKENDHKQEMRYLQLEARVESVNSAISEVKTTVLEEGKERKKEADRLLDHVLNNDVYSRQHKRDMETTRQELFWKWFMRISVAGGALTLLIEWFINKF